MQTRRDFLKKTGMAIGAGYVMTNLDGRRVFAVPLPSPNTPLNDPALTPKFVNAVPDAMAPGFKYEYFTENGVRKYTVGVGRALHDPGLGLGSHPIYGYGTSADFYSWPGRTFEVVKEEPVEVTWLNDLEPEQHLLPVDTSLHWAYGLHGYEGYSIEQDGTPVVMHLHGGHSAYQFDGNPEFFFNHDLSVLGPRYETNVYTYLNDQVAGTLWYHDHALGITRLNVYAGMAGFYILRDDDDTGLPGNPLGLPAWPYELAFAIQDRMYTADGQLFYPAFPGDPAYDDFIDPGYEGPHPTALAEFFGDHMLVNGKAWPKADVEPTSYRMRLLNGCDSRFLTIRLRVVVNGAKTNPGHPHGAQTFPPGAEVLPIWVVGSDQGLAADATQVETLLIGPGERYDVVVDFSSVKGDARVIMENLAGDAPFGGDIGDDVAPADLFPDRQTDRIIAFDVVKRTGPPAELPPLFDPSVISSYWQGVQELTTPTVRRVALYEGTDHDGRLMPMLGTLEGSMTWDSPYTETPGLNTTEVWEIYNATEDAHPIHLHLVHFEILNRQAFTADLVEIPVLQHNGDLATGAKLTNVELVGDPYEPAGEERAPKDMVTVYPGELARIKVSFDKPGRYVWHCHILSHEDHEMMRVLEVRPIYEG